MVSEDLFPILCTVFLALGLLCHAVSKPNIDNLFGTIFCIVCFAGFFICLVLGAAIQKPSGRNQYLVKIDENYPLAEIIEQYDIVEMRNADTGLYLLEDKKD